MAKKVICFGEMLWDCFPDSEIPGGAPMNVALHLCQLGLEVGMISSLGKDAHGQKLMDFTKEYGLDQSLIQIDEDHATGKVLVDNTDPQNIRYDIVAPSAWDYIDWNDANQQAVENAEALVFGSLSVRNEKSWETLYHLLHSPILKIFDINLRAPFYDFEQIEIMLGYTDILKINEDELLIVSEFFDIDLLEAKDDPIKQANLVCEYLTENFPIELICVTLGAKGALIYEDGQITRHPGYRVKVEDTIGAGDAFLAGFIKSYLEEKPKKAILDFACTLGAFVASKKGGTPKYQLSEIESVKKKID